MGHLDKCRVCFTPVARDDEAYNLLQLEQLAVKFSDCTGLVVDPADVHIISSEICCQCYEQLEQYHGFRAQCITADRKWRVKRRVGQRKIIREEPLYLEEDQEEAEQEMEEEQEMVEEQEMEEEPEMDEEQVMEEQELEEQELEELQLKEIQRELEEQIEKEMQKEQEEQSQEEQDQKVEEQPSLQATELILCDGNLSPKESPPKMKRKVQRKSSPKKPAKKAKEKETATVTSTPELRYMCEMCSKEFEDYKSFINHTKEHDGHSLYHCSEPGCQESFNRYEQCRQHELQHAAEGTRFICGEEGCHKMYRHKASLKHHQSKAHGLGEPPKTHMCEFCGRVFKNLAALTHHRYTHSDQMKLPFACEMPDCTLRFISQEKLRIHMMRHQGIKNYSCPYCGLRKTTKNELRLHINFHTLERSWPCKFCSKVCNSSTALKKHVSTIHEKNKHYACSYCEKSFASSNTRKYHEMTHTGEKNFECQECGKKFIQPAALRTHRLMHERKAVTDGGETSTSGGESLVTHSIPQIDVGTPVIVAQLQPAYTILQVTSLGYPTI